MHTFLIEAPCLPGQPAALPPGEAHHALRVLRVKPGEAVCLTDGRGGRWSGKVCSAGDGQVVCQVDAPLPQAESPARITLYQGLPKADKLELIAQKAAELGVAALYPVAMTRSVTRWNQKEAEKKRERLERIAQEAMKQCGRSRLMQVGPLLSWAQALAAMAAHPLMIMPWEEAAEGRMAQLGVRFPEARDIGILIGPEGGIAQEEAGAAAAAGARIITLGPRILRCETAAICACTLAQSLWGDV